MEGPGPEMASQQDRGKSRDRSIVQRRPSAYAGDRNAARQSEGPVFMEEEWLLCIKYSSLISGVPGPPQNGLGEHMQNIDKEQAWFKKNSCTLVKDRKKDFMQGARAVGFAVGEQTEPHSVEQQGRGAHGQARSRTGGWAGGELLAW